MSSTATPRAAVPPAEAARASPIRLGRAQWIMLAGLCLMYMITYIDRVNISTAAPYLQKDLHLGNAELGLVFSAFAVPYGFLQPLGGWVGDRFGPRWVLFLAGAFWSAATAATGLATGMISLIAARLGLGLGEGATFPTATKAMTSWLPAGHRGLAQGVTHSFARLGNAIAPPLVGYMILAAGWRVPFYVLGAVSLVWVVWWFAFFRDDPRTHRGMSETHTCHLPEAAMKAATGPIPWARLIRLILPVTIVDFCYGWTLWVYLTWLPSFLAQEYHLKLKQFAWFSAGILLAGVIGDTVGGLVSDAILRRTSDLRAARRFNLVVGLLGSLAFLAPCLVLRDLTTVAVLLSLAFFFLELTNSVLWALPMDMAPRYAGIAGGLMNTGFGVAGVLSPAVFGALQQATGSWVASFSPSVGLLLVGVLLSLRIDPRRTLEESA
jgi:MFS family permease